MVCSPDREVDELGKCVGYMKAGEKVGEIAENSFVEDENIELLRLHENFVNDEYDVVGADENKEKEVEDVGKGINGKSTG